ncbi:hypothetical protein V2J09_022882 [Rumex salicifolius]
MKLIPLFMAGDFNCILSMDERIGGGGREAFTLTRRSFRRSLMILPWLDRALVNLEACFKWPNAIVRHLPKFASDHTPLLLNLDPTASQNRHRMPFRFEGAWLLHPSFREFLDGAWNGENDMVEALSRLRPKLIFRNIEEKKKELLEKLDRVQSQVSRTPSQSLIREDASIQKDLDQKSRELWLQVGDRNIAFFHTSTLICRKHSRILMLKCADETWVEDSEALERLQVDFFGQLYHLLVEDIFPITSSHGLFPVLTVDRWRELEKPISDELHKVVCSMGAYKAPGPDGFQPCFFQKLWDTTGPSVLAKGHQFS